MLPWKLIKFSFLLKDSLKVLEETNEKQQETSKSSVFILYDISHRPQLSTPLVPILLVQFFACLTYLYVGGKYHYCNFFMPLDGLFSSLQCRSIQLQAGAIWRQAVTATVTALHCLFVCLDHLFTV